MLVQVVVAILGVASVTGVTIGEAVGGAIGDRLLL